MRNKIIHKIISLILIVSILLPLSFAFSHALEKHEHNICVSKTEKHIHTQEIDCSVFHYFTDVQSFSETSKSINFSIGEIFSVQIFIKSNYFSNNKTKHLVRGPPTINVF